MKTNNYYITTPIYYVNDSPHIGHAYCSLACDITARYKRLDGCSVKFLTGTDEHGQKVEKAAKKADISPQDFVDTVSKRHRYMAEFMNYTNDDFIRTTEERHKKATQAFWKKLEENGDIYLDKYSGWYSVRDEAFFQESELVEGKAPTGAEVEWIEEESYFFRLSAYEDKLLKYYQENPDFIAPESKRKEVISFVKGGLKDLSISRTSFNWGVPVPNNDKHVMYVWIDALVNYLTALGYPDTSCEEYQNFWPADLHIIGKDILRFHAVYWPAFLMSANIVQPKRIFAHGWWMNEGEKMSKSLGNIIDPIILVKEFGLDQVRYYLMKQVPFGNDGNFSRSSMITTINADLANNIGNLAQRTLSMIYKNCDGKIPQNPNPTNEDKKLLTEFEYYYREYREAIEQQNFHNALLAVTNYANIANEYIDEQAPWVLKKENPQRMAEVLYVLAEAIRKTAILLQPFTPDSADKLLEQLNTENRDFSALEEPLKSGISIPLPEGIFPRFIG